MFAPLAFAYIISIAASLLVALTVTPALCYYLLGRSKLLHDEKDSRLVAWLKRRYARILNWTLRASRTRSSARRVAMLVVALLLFPFMGREFLPPFNEGALNINATLPPGTSLQESNRIGSIDRSSAASRRPKSSRRRAARAAPNWTSMRPASTRARSKSSPEQGDRPHAEVMEEVRQNLAQIPGVDVGSRPADLAPHRPSAVRHARADRHQTLRARSGDAAQQGRRDPRGDGRRSRASSICWSSRRSACRRFRSI